MDKISGILPASARTSVSEISSSQPARPGAVATGRPAGRNSLGDRVALSKELEKIKSEMGKLPDEQPVLKDPAGTYKNTAENSKRQTIEDLNKKFFSNPKELARENADITRSEEVAENVEHTEPVMAPRFPQESHAPLTSTTETHP